MEEKHFYVGAKKNVDGSVDLSQAATFKQKEKMSEEKKKKAHKKFSDSIETQEAKNKLVVLKDELKNFKESLDTTSQDDVKAVVEMEKEIALWERVAKGEKLFDVMKEFQTEEDKKRIEKSRKNIKNIKLL